MPDWIAWAALGVGVVVFMYAYAGYPALLKMLPKRFPVRSGDDAPEEWPRISISLPAYNEAAQIRETIESLLAIDYPADRRQILIVSDCSDDGTDDIVREYADHGVELLRMPERTGKTGAENAAHERLTGEIIVNTDASIRIHPGSVKHLVAQFQDEEVGLASGRDVSVGADETDTNQGESSYTGYEMTVRALETGVHGIIGASGCFYAIRKFLHLKPLPAGLSRDFASALISRENGYRAVSVNAATCLVPRTPSLQVEYRRKVRTIARGIRTLNHKRHLMNPFRFGRFSWMLFSHKVCRWLTPWAALLGFVAVGALGLAGHLWAQLAFGAGVAGLLAAWIGYLWAARGTPPKLLMIPTFVVVSHVAVGRAWIRAATWRGNQGGIWEPTRRPAGVS